MESKADMLLPELPPAVAAGRRVVDRLLSENAHRSGEILAGIDGERFHTEDMDRLVMYLTRSEASDPLRVAAMGHDAERFSVPGAGVGYQGIRSGPEYEAYKKRHAAKSAAIMTEGLRAEGVSEDLIERTGFLITHHDDTREEIRALNDPDLDVLVAADTLSWLNFSAPNYFNGREPQGVAGLRAKMGFMLGKLPDRFFPYLPGVPLTEPAVLPHLADVSRTIATARGIPVPEFAPFKHP